MTDFSNGFFNFPDEDTRSISDIIANLSLNRRNGRLDYFRLSKDIENNKINTIFRLVKSRLDSDPTIKVVIFVKLIENLEKLNSMLFEYNPLVMTSDRKEQIHIFNKSTSEHRLLIATRKCLDIKLPLDDVDGNFPRHVFFTLGIDVSNLNYTFTNQSRSKTIIQFIYDKKNEKEIIYLGSKNIKCSQFIEE